MIFLFNSPISIIAILVAAIANVIVGIIWYHPKVLGTVWLKLVGKKKEDLVSKPTDMLLGFVGALAMSFGLALVIGYATISTAFISIFTAFAGDESNISTILSGEIAPAVLALLVAFVCWLGFVVPTALNEVIWEGRNKKLFAFNMAHLLTTMIIMSLMYVLIAGTTDVSGLASL